MADNYSIEPGEKRGFMHYHRIYGHTDNDFAKNKRWFVSCHVSLKDAQKALSKIVAR